MSEIHQKSKVPPTACPGCGAVLDACCSTGETRDPRPGDYSVCTYCAAVLQFDDEMKTHKVDSIPGIDEYLDDLRKLILQAAALRN